MTRREYLKRRRRASRLITAMRNTLICFVGGLIFLAASVSDANVNAIQAAYSQAEGVLLSLAFLIGTCALSLTILQRGMQIMSKHNKPQASSLRCHKCGKPIEAGCYFFDATVLCDDCIREFCKLISDEEQKRAQLCAAEKE